MRFCISDRFIGGIGFATVKLFLQSGAKGIVLVDITSSALESAVATLSSDDRGKCELLAADVTSESNAEAYVAKAIERWGRLDISVQNAGIASERVSILETDVSLWERTMSVNALGGMFSIAETMTGNLPANRQCSWESNIQVEQWLRIQGEHRVRSWLSPRN